MSIKTYNKEKIDEMYKECKEIIEIAAFPTTNIKTDALYILNGDKIYRYINNEWVELIPEATDDISGVVKYDDETIKKNTDKQLYVREATDELTGVVKYDNETIQKNTDKQLYVREATDELTGVIKYDNETIQKNTDKQLYVREATDELTGVVKYDNETIQKNTDEKLYVREATDELTGVVKYDNETIKKNTDKQLYVREATDELTGVVKYDDETIKKNTDKQLYVREATDELTGVVKYDDETIKKNTDKQLYVVDQDRVIEIPVGSEGTITAEEFEKLAKGSYSLKSGVYIYKLTGSQAGKLYFETLYSFNEDKHTVGQITIDSDYTWTKMITTIEKSSGGVIEVPSFGYVLTDDEYEKIKTGSYSLRLPDGRQFDPVLMDDTNGEYYFGQTRSFHSGVVACDEIYISHLAKKVNDPIEGRIGYPDNITIKKAVDNSIYVPNATDTQKGVVKIDDETIKINSNGQLYSVGGGLTCILLESGVTSGTLTDEEVGSLGINTILNLDKSYYRYSKKSGVYEIYEHRTLDKTKSGSEICKRITVNTSNNTWMLENGLTLYPIDDETIKVNGNGKMYANVVETIIDVTGNSGTLTDEQYEKISQNPEKVVMRRSGYFFRFEYSSSSSVKYSCCHAVSSSPPYLYMYTIEVKTDKTWKYIGQYAYQNRYRHIIHGTYTICDIISTSSTAYTTETLASWLNSNGFKDPHSAYPCSPKQVFNAYKSSSSRYELPYYGIASSDGKTLQVVLAGCINGGMFPAIDSTAKEQVATDKVLTIY